MSAAPFLAVLAALAPAQAAPPMPVFTLPEALAYSRTHQPELRRALLALRAREVEARVPRAAWLPQVGATAQLFVGTANNTTASYLNVREVALPRIGASRSGPDTVWAPSPSTLVAVSLGQQVYEFGRIAAQTAVLDALAAAERARAQASWLDVRLRVEETFSAVLAARRVLAATEDALRRASAHRDLASAGVRSGMRPPVDLARAQADVARIEVQRARAEGGLEAARAALAAAVGSEALLVDAAEPPPCAAPCREPASPVLAESLQGAARRNPAILAALAQQEAQARVTSAITRELLPDLFFSAGLSGRAGGAPPSSGDVPTGAGWLPDVGNWHAGLVLHGPLLDATVLARRAASRAREEVARADLEVVRREVALQVQRVYLDLVAAVRTLPGLEAAVSAAQASQAQADARFRAGLGTFVELTDAEALLVNAQLDLAIGRFAVARARAQLARAVGDAGAPQP